MNHCRDCNSDYSSPGTCNCFAVGGKRSVSPPAWYPWQQAPWYVPLPSYPIYPANPYPYWYGNSGTSITVGNIPNGSPFTTGTVATTSTVEFKS